MSQKATQSLHIGEPLYTVKAQNGEVFITGFTERSVAERFGVRHLTVCALLFVADGPDRGKLILHNREAKLRAKGKKHIKAPSYNLFGGHVTADIQNWDCLGQPVPMAICAEAIHRELEEELLQPGSIIPLVKWEREGEMISGFSGESYPVSELIPLGFATFESGDNVEISYFYALPIPGRDVDRLMAADNAVVDGSEINIMLPIEVMSEAAVKDIYDNDPSAEVADGISRLWLPENRGVLDQFRAVKQQICVE